MSRRRLEDVLKILQGQGWTLLDERDYPLGSTHPFALQDEEIRWGLTNKARNRLLELEFHAFSDLGQRTDNLADILYCIDLSTGAKLYFAKRDSLEWRNNLAEFVEKIKGGRVANEEHKKDKQTQEE